MYEDLGECFETLQTLILTFELVEDFWVTICRFVSFIGKFIFLLRMVPCILLSLGRSLCFFWLFPLSRSEETRLWEFQVIIERTPQLVMASPTARGKCHSPAVLPWFVFVELFFFLHPFFQVASKLCCESDMQFAEILGTFAKMSPSREIKFL